MPGQLKSDSRCPLCLTPLLAITDTTSSDKVVREYFHQKGFDGPDAISPKARRKKRCLKIWFNLRKAAAERRALEI